MEKATETIPVSSHPTTLEKQWLNAVSPEDFIRNNKNFNSLMMKYRCAIREIQTKLEVLNDEFSVANQRNPISSIKSRIKTPASIYEKLRRKNLPFTEESIVKNLDDVAGIRVICPFIGDIYTMANLISSQDAITVLKIKDYIQKPKDNGYRSYHMIVEIPVYFSDQVRPVRCEIQIRTIAMDFWATLDHDMQYKKKVEDAEEIMRELRECADIIHQTDEKMMRLRERIHRIG